MGKPWAKIEIGYINHPKFLALAANAICLWHEGKAYCDEFATDGLIPMAAVKHFRFAGKTSIAALLLSCGQKSETEAYAPLWEVHPLGFKMHDYLNYNDCRDEIRLRIEDADERADLRRLHNKESQRATRAARKDELAKAVSRDRSDVQSADRQQPVSKPSARRQRVLSRPTATATPTTTDPQKPIEQVSEGGRASAPPPPRPGAPIHDRSHQKHAVCGRVCLHASLFNDFVRRRNHPAADGEIRAWAAGVIDEWTFGAFEAVEPGDPFEFWKARYAEQWPAASADRRAHEPEWIRIEREKAAKKARESA